MLAFVELPDPVPGPGEVLVDVAAADTLFVETQLRSGWGREWFDLAPPYVPGNAVSGTVLAVGSDVDARWVGRRVAAHTGPDGGYADRAVAPVTTLVELPDALSHELAAALTHDGATAFGLLDAVPVHGDDRVLVTAAAGGRGRWPRPAAPPARRRRGCRRRRRGARAAQARPGRRSGRGPGGLLARRVGEACRRAHRRRPECRVRRAGGEIGRTALDIVTDGGRFSAHGAAGGAFGAAGQTDGRVTVTGIENAQHSPARLADLTARAFAATAASRLRPVVGATYPLDRAADAHRAIEARAVPGTTLLLP